MTPADGIGEQIAPDTTEVEWTDRGGYAYRLHICRLTGIHASEAAFDLKGVRGNTATTNITRPAAIQVVNALADHFALSTNDVSIIQPLPIEE